MAPSSWPSPLGHLFGPGLEAAHGCASCAAQGFCTFHVLIWLPTSAMPLFDNARLRDAIKALMLQMFECSLSDGMGGYGSLST
mmetsp:Transcript_37675/g.52527  ORF Transcript_37675/g.52527 Transcript_37675/m.52527 type:complete len:83 (-) Transcript_37675:408-656(-)